MANHFSALKRARQTETRTARNRATKSRMRTALRRLREAVAAGNADAAQQAYNQTVSVLDKSVSKGVVHKNTASRYKARLMARVKALSTKQ
jgi:small subunit ribosomal protein S20